MSDHDRPVGFGILLPPSSRAKPAHDCADARRVDALASDTYTTGPWPPRTSDTTLGPRDTQRRSFSKGVGHRAFQNQHRDKPRSPSPPLRTHTAASRTPSPDTRYGPPACSRNLIHLWFLDIDNSPATRYHEPGLRTPQRRSHSQHQQPQPTRQKRSSTASSTHSESHDRSPHVDKDGLSESPPPHHPSPPSLSSAWTIDLNTTIATLTARNTETRVLHFFALTFLNQCLQSPFQKKNHCFQSLFETHFFDLLKITVGFGCCVLCFGVSCFLWCCWWCSCGVFVMFVEGCFMFLRSVLFYVVF